ncbi:protein AGENET DOMAIN (AGD)-CONTAINING P1 [Telopea speciosissima]|uniref:protein AGENET DOMAIN (AGD)-CONTAINING P1 n=1 Tax=Telopea speciosissima TaxID=54955 RepID=UPI001CC672BE|nr:protein AGENET DOMAIN (AGD)-CONTAINING P1 [Telopea speciosissima]
MAFRIGGLVEICSKEEGFVGSYYSAEIIFTAEKTHFLVEYKNLLAQDGKRLLREIVRADEVRPYPPAIQVSKLGLFDRVDAYDKDGWWVGRITRRNKSRYHVYFESTGEEIAYSVSQLRVHQEWKNGKWTDCLVVANLFLICYHFSQAPEIALVPQQR